MRTLIKNAWILTMNEKMQEYKDGQIVIEDDKILYVGKPKEFDSIDDIVDAKNCLVLPGMVNTHCHVSMLPFRSLQDDCPDRLRRFLFPLENACMNEDLAYYGACYGTGEMLLSGITTFADMYYFMDKVALACEKMGIRAVLGETIIDQPTCDAKNAVEALKIGEKFIEEWKHHPLITPMLAPHATNTNTEEIFRKAMEIVKKHDTLMMTHVAEMDYEMTYFRNKYNMTPIEWLESISCLNQHVLAVHCIHINEADIQLMKKHDVKVSHCPVSNLKAGKGIAPAKDIMENGVAMGFGTDGASSGNTLDLFIQMRMFAGAQKTKYHDRSLFPAKEIVRIATIEGAKALRIDEQIGSLEVGKKADIVLISLESAHMFPVYDPYSILVYSANASDVKDVFVNGKQVVSDRKLKVDLSILREQLQKEMKEFSKKAEELSK